MNHVATTLSPPGADAATGRQLRSLVDALRRARAPTEGVFLSLGDRLGEAVMAINTLSTSLERLCVQMDGPEIVQATDGLGTLGREVDALARSSAEKQEVLARLETMVAGGADRMVRLRKILGEVGVLAINARIQVAQIGGSGADFTIFTGEIGRLAGLAQAGMDQLAASLDRLGELILKARSGHETFERNHGRELREIGGRLDRCLKAMADHRHRARTALQGLTDKSHEVGVRIAEAVGALQVNDITRQRIEHVEEALLAVAGILDPAGAGETAAKEWSSQLSAEEKAVLSASVCRLQNMQLARASEHFSQQVERLIGALRKLATDTEDICHKGGEVSGGGRAGGTFLGQLRDELGGAEVLLEKYGLAGVEMLVVVRRVASSVEEMIGHVDAVHSIEADMRIMGLNATLKCGRLGSEGRALAVIAQELRSCAGRTEEEAAAIGGALGRMIETARGLAAETGGKDELSTGALILRMHDSLEPLEQGERDFAGALGGLENNGARIEHLLAEAADGVTVHRDLAAAVANACATLGGLAGSVERDGDDAKRLRDHLLSLLKGHYTMSAEREIHLLLDGDGDGGHAAPAPAAEVDLDDILF